MMVSRFAGRIEITAEGGTTVIRYSLLIINYNLEVNHTMVKIRLRRMGAKKAPYYRIVVADSRSPRDGRFIEELGTYDPMADGEKLTVNQERVQYWIANGAQPTDTVRGLLKKVEA